MAVIQYTAVVNQVRGKLNGSVFNKSKTTNTLQRKQQQPRGNRGYQSEIRSIFSEIQRRWKSLSVVNQESWATCAINNPVRDRFGNLVSLSGYNQFIKASILNSYGNGANLTGAYSSPAPSNEISFFELNPPVYTATGSGVSINVAGDVELGSYDGDWVALFEVSLPFSSGVTNYHGRFVSVVGRVMTSSWSLVGTYQLGRKFPLPQEGQRIIYRCRLVHRLSGAVVAVSEYTTTI